MERKPLTAAQIAKLKQTVEAGKKLIELDDARNDFLKFCKHIKRDINGNTTFKEPPHIRVIAEALEKVLTGEIDRLAISMPPRHGKSESVTRLFPAYYLGRDPLAQIILAGYSETFAIMEFGMKIKAILGSNEYQQLFPQAHIDMRSEGVSNLVTKHGGMIASVGRGGIIKGRGANLFIIDDPVKDDEDSDLVREKLWDWFSGVAMSRLEQPGGRMLVVMTRWSEDDLLGRLLDPKSKFYNAEEAAEWTYLKIPAEIKTEAMSQALDIPIGNFLWEEKIPKKFYQSMKRIHPRNWATLYMQEPAPEDGTFFKKEYIKPYEADEMPKNMNWFMAGDFAISDKERADSNCMGKVGVDEHGVLWVHPDLYWEQQSDTNIILDNMFRLLKADPKPQIFWAERGHISQSILPILRVRMQEEKLYVTIDDNCTPSKDKKTRARSIQARMSMGMVRLPKFAWWYNDAVDQMMKFDGGKRGGVHDDFIDMMSWFGIGLEREYPATAITPREPVAKVGSIDWVKASSKQQKLIDERRRASGGF